MAAKLAPLLCLATASLLLSTVGGIAISQSGQSKRAPGAEAALITRSVPAPPPTRSVPPKFHPVVPVAPTTRPRSRPPLPSPTSKPSPTIKPSAPAGSQPRAPRTVALLNAVDDQSLAQAVFQALNHARASQHLSAMVWSPRLQQSAHEHDLAMASANTLAHQVGREQPLGNRETRVGVDWTFAAENIGWSSARTLSGALGIESSMFGEVAPNDPHRRNILSTEAHAVGVDVLIDLSHGRLWLTEDFSDRA